MRPSRTRSSLRFAIIALAAWVAVMDAASAQEITREYRIAQQSLGQALREFALASNVDLLFPPDLVAGKKSPTLDGKFTVDEGLRRLLQGSGLEYSVSGSRVVISHASSEPEARPVDGADSSSAQRPLLEEIVVTAQKRQELLRDVPVPVTAISATSLLEHNQLRLQDYYTRVPGLSLITSDANSVGASLLAIRGITSGPGLNPTVGVVVDDVPYGSSTSWGSGLLAPDIDPNDLARIEVLRGPQGTLYGASSIGGLLKYMTVDPDTDAFSGQVQVGFSHVQNGSALGHNVRASFNVPLSNTFAVRASGFHRRDPGYIDDPVLDLDGVNESRATGGRLAASWRPSERLSVKLSALLQDNTRDGSPNVLTTLGDLEQNFLRETGTLDRHDRAYSATLTTMLGAVELTAITGYNVSRNTVSIDYTRLFAPATEALFGVTGTPDILDIDTTKLTQELRISTSLGPKVEWLLGGFYADEDASNKGRIVAVDADTGSQAGVWWTFDNRNTYSEFAAFTHFTAHVTERFDVQVGAREGEIRQTQKQDFAGVYNTLVLRLPNPFVFPRVTTDASAFTYLVTPRFRVSPGFMAYARFASGYRPGGTNSSASGAAPPEFKPDRTHNYEIGLKGAAFDEALAFDASLYYIEWDDIQVLLLDPNFDGYYDNAGKARSQGVELSVEARSSGGLAVAAWAAWNDAELTEAFPPNSLGVARPGERLPFSSRLSGNLSVDQEVSFASGMTGFVGVSLSYVGSREGVFASRAVSPPQRQIFPSYVQSDLRAGARYNGWSANVFVTNLTDKRGVLGGGIGTLYPNAFNYTQPRTFGFSISRKL
jgi:iron complex outermembrane recepter protein